MSIYEKLLAVNADPEMTKAAHDADNYENRLLAIEDYLEKVDQELLSPWAKTYGEKVRNKFLHGQSHWMPEARMV